MKEILNPDAQITFTPIGTIHSPFTEISGMPIQPAGARGVKGTLVIFKEYGEGLSDLDGFSRIIIIYAFHKCDSCQLTVTPFLDTRTHGVFATRAPCRPNAIGLSIVRLLAVKGCEVVIEGVDVLDGTPLLDIKPYVPAFDCYPDEKSGWLAGCRDAVESMKSDERFFGSGM
ncbi:MAG: tRNA (N6-threonylcarbamoyladenosine(37)-N6)-methyltransferase TrmO [Methanoregula sp.]|jgi:tRNA-Thr(GGU) m(6)t(6)A37 methyltransferase TsaA|nr:tRNA (N6-threonylcarbamoyladenosine(37)-N6)-methyltransferase TrmO [Methanoregula sp.]